MNDTTEEWRDVIAYEGFYKVSSLGRVTSLHKIKGVICGIKKQSFAGEYLSTTLSRNNPKKRFYIHFLVADAFLLPKPGTVVDHINNIKTDNRACNLQRITPRQNVRKSMLSSSGFTGVYKTPRNTWHARIFIEGRRIHLGYHKCLLKAAITYQRALKIHLVTQPNITV